MASLPSFVELMASLGLEPNTAAPAAERSPSPALQSSSELPCAMEKTGDPTPTRSTSSPSLNAKEATRYRVSRYSPYSTAAVSVYPALSKEKRLIPTQAITRRRGSLSSVSSSSDFETSPLSAVCVFLK